MAEDINWKIVWREIGWVYPESTIREGWAIEEKYHKICIWIEGNCLAVHDPTDYYPTGCYDIPLNLIEQLKHLLKKESDK